MSARIRAALVSVAALAMGAFAMGTLAAPAAEANVLSLLGGCGNQTASQPFAQWGDRSNYTLVPGGNFEAGGAPWLLTGGAAVQSGNESYHVGSAGDSHSLALPAGSSAISPASCTNLYHPTVRLFVRNTGSASSHLVVQALYPGLLGGVQTTTIGNLSGSSSWAPSPAMSLLVSNLLATLSLNQTVIAFRFTPADRSGAWSIDDVYLDPYGRS